MGMFLDQELITYHHSSCSSCCWQSNAHQKSL